MSMNPDPQGQRPGLFGRIGNFFGAGDPNAGQPTDPFANLSRAQRTMLGFAALRDAAASLEGRDSNYFAQAMGGFEQARERERLRAQGQFANQVNLLTALSEYQRQASIFSASNLPVPEALQQTIDIISQAALPAAGVAAPVGGGMATPAAGGGATPMETPVDFTGGTLPTDLPSGPQGVTGPPPTGVVYEDAGTVTPRPYTGEAESVAPRAATPTPASSSDPMAALDQREAELLQQIATVGALQGDTRALELELATIESQREQLARQAVEGEQATRGAEMRGASGGVVLRTIGDLRTAIQENPSLTTGFGASLLAGLPGSAALDAQMMAQTIRSNIGLDTLQSIREASPTGGALGSVSERELDEVQAVIGSLNLEQSPERILQTLDEIERRYQNLIRRAYETTEDRQSLDDIFGGTPAFISGGAATPTAPAGEIQFNLR